MTNSITAKQLMAKARGFTLSIEKMNEKQRLATPTGDYAEDYNRLHDLTKESFPTLSALLPPPIKIYSTNYGDRYSEASFGAIDTYCEQIYQLLSELE